MTSLRCVHTLYNNTNINTNDWCQNAQSYMCTYPLHQHKNKYKLSLPNWPVLDVYIPYTTTQTQIQTLVAKIPSLACVQTLYNNTNIHTYHQQPHQWSLSNIISPYCHMSQLGVHTQHQVFFQSLSHPQNLFHILHLSIVQIQQLIKAKYLEKISYFSNL